MAHFPRKARLESGEKIPFRIGVVLSRIRRAIQPFPKAMLFQLADEGYRSVFEQVIACMISIRTLDEVSLSASKRLFAKARTPKEIARLSFRTIDRLISPATFHRQKAERIRSIARFTERNLDGSIPCDEGLLNRLPGIGPKCANLVLGISCGEARIGVDVHVHRIASRWGYIRSRDPVKAIAELESKLPKKYWVEINALLVPFGKHVCRGNLPKCSACPVLSMCRQVGVKRHL